MLIKQLSIFIENRPGKVVAVMKTLQENGVNVRALCLSDTSDFGILRLIVADPEEACAKLQAAGCAVSVNEVLAIGMDDRPGSLAETIQCLADADINIEYMYAFTGKIDGRAYVIIRVADNERAKQTLKAAGAATVCQRDLYAL